jgi:hypothetical protein
MCRQLHTKHLSGHPLGALAPRAPTTLFIVHSSRGSGEALTTCKNRNSYMSQDGGCDANEGFSGHPSSVTAALRGLASCWGDQAKLLASRGGGHFWPFS